MRGKYSKCVIFSLISGLFFVSRLVPAQQTDAKTHSAISSNIIEMNDKISFRFEINNDIEFFEIKNDNIKYDIRPNSNTALRFSSNYRDITLSVQFAPKFLGNNNDDDLRGDTKNRRFSIAYNVDQWMHELTYFNIKGYFLSNYNKVTPNSKESIKFPDMAYKGIRGSSGYRLNPDFSIKAITSLTERQLENAGSFIPSFVYLYYVLDNVEFVEANFSQRSSNLELALYGSYYYTVILERDLYFSLGLNPGVGLIGSRLHTCNFEGTKTNGEHSMLFRLGTEFSFGYNGPNYYAGINTVFSSSSYNQKSASISTSKKTAFFRIFVGFRIHEIKKVKDLYEKYIKY